MSEPITDAVCLARMEAGRNRFDSMDKSLAEIAQNTAGLSVLKDKVERHDRIINWILGVLAAAGVIGLGFGFVHMRDFMPLVK